MVPTGHDTDGGSLLKERYQGEHRFDEIVVLRVLEVEGKSASAPTAGSEQALAQSDLQDVHDAEWKRSTGMGAGDLPQNGYKLSEEIRRSSEFRKRGSLKEVLATFSQETAGQGNLVRHTSSEDLSAMEPARGANEMADERSDLDCQFDKPKLDDSGLRNRVWALEEEKGRLHKDLASTTLKETILREKVREFELQMDGHRKRVERAEKTILELRQAGTRNKEQARQAEDEVEQLRIACAQKDAEKQDMQKRIERLQQLCTDHEKSIHGLRQGLKNGMDGNKEGRMSRLQRELQRLSGAEITLRTELEASRGENTTLRRDISSMLERFASEQRDSAMQLKKLDQELRAEIDRGQAQVAELRDENNLLFAKLRLVMRERQDTKEALRTSKARLQGIEEESKDLQEEVLTIKTALQAKEAHVDDLEMQLDNLTKSKQMFQTALALREKAGANCGTTSKVKEKEKEPRDGQHMESEMRQSLQAAAQQLYSMNGRLEALMDKLSDRDVQLQEALAEIVQKDDLIRGLEHSLKNLAKTVDSQSARLMRLTKQNEHTNSLTNSQFKQIENLQTQIATAVERKNKAEEELEQAKQRMENWEQEIQLQGMNCQLLRDRVGTMEADLRQCHTQMTLILQRRDELSTERDKLQNLLAATANQVTALEQQLAERDQKIKLQESRLEELKEETNQNRGEVGRLSKERDEIQKEAEAMSREALRTSMEVEVLRRRIHQLDEDVLVRDGQICILRGSLEES